MYVENQICCYYYYSDIDECVGNACQNSATCVDGINEYTCVCVAGYDGTFCENSKCCKRNSLESLYIKIYFCHIKNIDHRTTIAVLQIKCQSTTFALMYTHTLKGLSMLPLLLSLIFSN